MKYDLEYLLASILGNEHPCWKNLLVELPLSGYATFWRIYNLRGGSHPVPYYVLLFASPCSILQAFSKLRFLASHVNSLVMEFLWSGCLLFQRS